MSTTLDDEVDCFFAEVNAISDETPDLLQNGAPNTDWVVHVDPNTNLPFYYNQISKTSTWEMPEEYKLFLKEYEAFIKKPTHNEKQVVENDEDVNNLKQSKRCSSQNFTMPVVNARKRRRMKRAWLRSEARSLEDSVPVEFLSEYIAYSNSSESDSDESSGRHSSPASRDDSPSPNLSESIDSPVITSVENTPNLSQFIGPLPAPCSAKDNLDSNISSCLDSLNEVHSVKPQKKESISDSSNPTIHTSHDQNAKYQTPPFQTSDFDHLKELTEILLEKMASFDVKLDLLSPLQILFIQLSTRLEDWRSGHLSHFWFEEKLKEINSYINDYEQTKLPSGWLCSWDRENKKYSYTCEATGVTQFHLPLEVETTQSTELLPASQEYEKPTDELHSSKGSSSGTGERILEGPEFLSLPTVTDSPHPGESSAESELQLKLKETSLFSVDPSHDLKTASNDESVEEENDDYFYLVEKMLNEVDISQMLCHAKQTSK